MKDKLIGQVYINILQDDSGEVKMELNDILSQPKGGSILKNYGTKM